MSTSSRNVWTTLLERLTVNSGTDIRTIFGSLKEAKDRGEIDTVVLFDSLSTYKTVGSLLLHQYERAILNNRYPLGNVMSEMLEYIDAIPQEDLPHIIRDVEYFHPLIAEYYANNISSKRFLPSSITALASVLISKSRSSYVAVTTELLVRLHDSKVLVLNDSSLLLPPGPAASVVLRIANTVVDGLQVDFVSINDHTCDIYSSIRSLLTCTELISHDNLVLLVKHIAKTMTHEAAFNEGYVTGHTTLHQVVIENTILCEYGIPMNDYNHRLLSMGAAARLSQLASIQNNV